LKAAEAAFKKVTTKAIEGATKAPSIPGVKETITLRIDLNVLETSGKTVRDGRTASMGIYGRQLANKGFSHALRKLYPQQGDSDPPEPGRRCWGGCPGPATGSVHLCGWYKVSD
jgi:hypothetical protein